MLFHESRLSRHFGAALCGHCLAARIGNGNRAARWRMAGTQAALPATRVVSIERRAAQSSSRRDDDGAFVPRAGASQNSCEARKIFLRALDRACRSWHFGGAPRPFHFAVRRHATSPAAASNQSVQTLDANGARSLVGGSILGNCYLSAMVCSATILRNAHAKQL